MWHIALKSIDLHSVKRLTYTTEFLDPVEVCIHFWRTWIWEIPFYNMNPLVWSREAHLCYFFVPSSWHVMLPSRRTPIEILSTSVKSSIMTKPWSHDRMACLAIPPNCWFSHNLFTICQPLKHKFLNWLAVGESLLCINTKFVNSVWHKK